MSVTRLDGQVLAEPESQKETAVDCYTDADFVDFATVLFAGAEDQCVGSEMVMGEGKVSLSVRCTSGPLEGFAGQLKGTYDQTHFAMVAKLATEGDGSAEVLASVSATWVGACGTPR